MFFLIFDKETVIGFEYLCSFAKDALRLSLFHLKTERHQAFAIKPQRGYRVEKPCKRDRLVDVPALLLNAL